MKTKQLICPPIPIVKIGIVGLGVRGIKALQRLSCISGAEVSALCDISEDALQNALQFNIINGTKPTLFSDWKLMSKEKNLDLIYICTDWSTHAEIAIYAMKCNKHTAIEVPAALTIEQCWELVNVAESEQKHCVILENCCYDEFELNTLQMVRNGEFGDIVHADCAYIHDLRSLNFPPTSTSKKGMNRLNYNTKHNGNIYPTHGLGPICIAMNINRGDRLQRLVSVSSRQQGISDYAREKFGEKSTEATRHYTLGDMNTTIITTEKGATIMLQHNISNPRPYSRIHSVTGTKGFFQKYPIPQIVTETDLNAQFSILDYQEIKEKYEHPFLAQYLQKGWEVSGDHFFDFIMDSRLIFALNNGLPTDLNVYDAALWSSIIPLTEISVQNGGAPIDIPDFTRGKWKAFNKKNF